MHTHAKILPDISAMALPLPAAPQVPLVIPAPLLAPSECSQDTPSPPYRAREKKNKNTRELFDWTRGFEDDGDDADSPEGSLSDTDEILGDYDIDSEGRYDEMWDSINVDSEFDEE